jgi:hypothetical protein
VLKLLKTGLKKLLHNNQLFRNSLSKADLADPDPFRILGGMGLSVKKFSGPPWRVPGSHLAWVSTINPGFHRKENTLQENRLALRLPTVIPRIRTPHRFDQRSDIQKNVRSFVQRAPLSIFPEPEILLKREKEQFYRGFRDLVHIISGFLQPPEKRFFKSGSDWKTGFI